jgi:hypothetical protein
VQSTAPVGPATADGGVIDRWDGGTIPSDSAVTGDEAEPALDGGGGCGCELTLTPGGASFALLLLLLPLVLRRLFRSPLG